MPRNKADFAAAAPDWVSPWPIGHENRTEYVSPEQQTANMRPQKTEYRTEVDRTSRGTAAKDAPMLTKSAYQEKHGWVSPFPQGHPDHTPMVSKEEQTENMQRRQ
jgi:hypothetical protein